MYAYSNLSEKTKEIEFLATDIMTDEAVRFFKTKMESGVLEEYEYVQILKDIDKKITQTSLNSIGIEAIHVYWPEEDLTISTKLADDIKRNLWIKNIEKNGRNWDNVDKQVFFSTSYPYIDTGKEIPDYFVIIEIRESYLNNVRDTVKNIKSSHAILRLPNGEFLSDETVFDEEIIQNATSELEEKELRINGQKMKILSKYNPNNEIQIISYFNLGLFMAPVYTINGITFAATFMILLIGLSLMYFFYRHILSNFALLIKKFRQVENGDLSAKIQKESKNEFSYVFNQFNQMIAGIKRLLLSLDKEYERHDLAERKQLQAQINPHFLYNSLFYITSVSHHPEAVEAMSIHLAEYYQYKTKAKELVTLEDEVKFSRTYLSIMAMRKSISYTVEMDEEILDEMILPLLIQPLLENAVEHGIEEKESAHQIILKAIRKDTSFIVSVEDDGMGLDDLEISLLVLRINQNSEDGTNSVGLRNVNQRLINYYGKRSALKIEKSKELGGLKVYFELEGDFD